MPPDYLSFPRKGTQQLSSFIGTEAQNIWIIDDPMVASERNLSSHPLADLPWERKLEQFSAGVLGKGPQLGISFHRITQLFSYVHVDDIRMTNEKPALLPRG